MDTITAHAVCFYCGNPVDWRHDPTGTRGEAWHEPAWPLAPGDDRGFRCAISPNGRHAPIPAISELYDVATDKERRMLDTLAERAGIIWDCSSCGWTNWREDETCDSCEAPR